MSSLEFFCWWITNFLWRITNYFARLWWNDIFIGWEGIYLPGNPESGAKLSETKRNEAKQNKTKNCLQPGICTTWSMVSVKLYLYLFICFSTAKYSLYHKHLCNEIKSGWEEAKICINSKVFALHTYRDDFLKLLLWFCTKTSLFQTGFFFHSDDVFLILHLLPLSASWSAISFLARSVTTIFHSLCLRLLNFLNS